MIVIPVTLFSRSPIYRSAVLQISRALDQPVLSITRFPRSIMIGACAEGVYFSDKVAPTARDREPTPGD